MISWQRDCRRRKGGESGVRGGSGWGRARTPRRYICNALLTACDPRPRKKDMVEPRPVQGTGAGRTVNKAVGHTSRKRRKCERAGERILCERGIEMPSCERTAVPPFVAETTPLSARAGSPRHFAALVCAHCQVHTDRSDSHNDHISFVKAWGGYEL